MTDYNNLEDQSEEQRYEIVFAGETDESCSLPLVKGKIAALFRIDVSRVESLFAGNPVVLKKGLSFDAAQKYRTVFENTGALCEVKPEDSPVLPPREEPVKKKETFSGTMYNPDAAPTVPPAATHSPPGASAYNEYRGNPAIERQPAFKRYLPLIIIILVVFMIIGIITKPKSTGEEKNQKGRKVTLAKFRQIKKVMDAAFAMTISEEITFPQSIRDIELFVKKFGSLFSPLIRNQGAKLFVDGWGQRIRYAAVDEMSYSLRSAGEDRILNTADDITISDGPGVDRAAAEIPVDMGVPSNGTFVDPKGFYAVTLLEGYQISDKSSMNRSKITFSYEDGVAVTILAHPMTGKWDPEAAMMEKVAAIDNGRAGPFSQFSLTGFHMTNLAGAEGYELMLIKGATIAHVFALVSAGGTAVSIAVVTQGADRWGWHDTLTVSIKNSLRIY